MRLGPFQNAKAFLCDGLYSPCCQRLGNEPNSNVADWSIPRFGSSPSSVSTNELHFVLQCGCPQPTLHCGFAVANVRCERELHVLRFAGEFKLTTSSSSSSSSSPSLSPTTHPCHSVGNEDHRRRSFRRGDSAEL